MSLQDKLYIRKEEDPFNLFFSCSQENPFRKHTKLFVTGYAFLSVGRKIKQNVLYCKTNYFLST